MKLSHAVLLLTAAVYIQAHLVHPEAEHEASLRLAKLHAKLQNLPLASLVPDSRLQKDSEDELVQHAPLLRRGVSNLVGGALKNNALTKIERTPLMSEFLARSRDGHGIAFAIAPEHLIALRTQLPPPNTRIVYRHETKIANHPWLFGKRERESLRDQGHFLKLGELARLRRMLKSSTWWYNQKKRKEEALVSDSISSSDNAAPAEASSSASKPEAPVAGRFELDLPEWGFKKLRTPAQRVQPALELPEWGTRRLRTPLQRAPPLALPEWGLRRPRTPLTRNQVFHSDSSIARTSESPDVSSSSTTSPTSSDPPRVDQRRLPARPGFVALVNA